jgi:hypothetical protein
VVGRLTDKSETMWKEGRNRSLVYFLAGTFYLGVSAEIQSARIYTVKLPKHKMTLRMKIMIWKSSDFMDTPTAVSGKQAVVQLVLLHITLPES